MYSLQQFNPHDIVQLKTGGPLMTVVDFNWQATKVICLWNTMQGEVRQAEFSPGALNILRIVKESERPLNANTELDLLLDLEVHDDSTVWTTSDFDPPFGRKIGQIKKP